jgi:hypothetical protein
MDPIQIAAGRARRRAQRREGAVMMVVLLVLMVATASAAVSIRSTQSEIQSAGQNRLAVQSQHASEAAMNSMFAYVDKLGPQLCQLWDYANSQLPPPMAMYGEPEIDSASRRNAARTWAFNLAGLQDPVRDERPALSNAMLSPNSGGTGASSGGGGSGGSSSDDLLGSFGPRQAYGLPPRADDAFAIDFTDCLEAPASMNAGSQLNGPRTEMRYFCTLTAHARLQTSSAASTRVWTFGSVEYRQDPLVRGHDSRATILTPAISLSLCRGTS